MYADQYICAPIISWPEWYAWYFWWEIFMKNYECSFKLIVGVYFKYKLDFNIETQIHIIYTTRVDRSYLIQWKHIVKFLLSWLLEFCGQKLCYLNSYAMNIIITQHILYLCAIDQTDVIALWIYQYPYELKKRLCLTHLKNL